MRILHSVLAGLALTFSVQAQGPGVFNAPKLKGDVTPAGPDLNAPWRKLYSNARQASLAAMNAGQKAAHPHAANERAINLLLMATKRDPAFVKPVFNLGVLCEMSERWEDALGFYKIVPSLEQDPHILETANSEVERLKSIIALVATPEGRRTRDFDIALVSLLDARIEPVVGADRAESLAKQDKTRWEAPALAAEMYAAQEKYADAAKSLEAAARVAPSDKRASLNVALEVASAQAKYQELVDSGVKSWEDKKYEDAANLYQEAWKVDPSHMDTGMDSAVAYLMADQIKQAVGVLSLLLQNDTAASSQKVKAMLKQLVPVSVEAKEALNTPDDQRTGSEVRLSAADRIAKAVGDLASAEVRQIARPLPAFIGEQQAAFESLPDPELISADLAKLSPEGIFDQYQHTVPALPQSSLPGDTPGVSTLAAPTVKDSQPSDVPKAQQARPSNPPDRPTLALPKFQPSTPPKDLDKPFRLLNKKMAAILSIVLLVSGLLFRAIGPLAEPAPLKIEVIKGNGANNNAVAMTSGTVIVRVMSGSGEIVPDALVVFTAPAQGASVNFGGDGSAAQCITDESGLAVAPHSRATGANGPVVIKVLATKKGAFTSASIYQMNLGVKDGSAPADFIEITFLSGPSTSETKSDSSRQIRLRVSDSSRRPIRGATIQCREKKLNPASHGSEDAVLLEGVTDASGEFASSVSYRKGHVPRECIIKATHNGLSATRYLALDQ